MKFPIYQVDAFASEVFEGNPAAICPLESWLPDEVMQSIAAENNLSETAFYVREGDGYALRWFTPEIEVDLCGHATLAAAHVVFLREGGDDVSFNTRSGKLDVSALDGLLTLDFPALPYKECAANEKLVAALGKKPQSLYESMDYMAVFSSEEEILTLTPDMALLRALDLRGVIVTAQGSSSDFVSRFFAPKAGIDEDPVTGSAHCVMAPYWAERLGKQKLSARQLSRRGGEVQCEVGDRVSLSGRAQLYLQGTILVPS